MTKKSVFQRDDNYWGKAASLWGKLPVPKYIAHNIFKDNAASDTAFKAGEVDVSQSFISDVVRYDAGWKDINLLARSSHII